MRFESDQLFALMYLGIDVIYIAPSLRMLGTESFKVWPTVPKSQSQFEIYRKGWQRLK